MMSIILYSNNCPKCLVLKRKLIEKKIFFDECNDIDIMIAFGFMRTPVLEINGERLDYEAAIEYVGNWEVH